MKFIVIKSIVWKDKFLPFAVIPPHQIAQKPRDEIRQWLETRYNSKIESFKIETH